MSYLAVIASLLAMHVPDQLPRTATTRVGEELRAGLAYVTRFSPIGTALLLLALVSTMGMPYTVLMPAVAAKVLHGGPHTLGLLMGAAGTGAAAARSTSRHAGACSGSAGSSRSR